MVFVGLDLLKSNNYGSEHKKNKEELDNLFDLDYEIPNEYCVNIKRVVDNYHYLGNCKFNNNLRIDTGELNQCKNCKEFHLEIDNNNYLCNGCNSKNNTKEIPEAKEINLDTIDDITNYLNDLKYPDSMLDEINENINLLKKYYYIMGKLFKEENKKYTITNEHRRNITQYIKNIQHQTTILTPHNNLTDVNLLKKLNMTREEMNCIFMTSYNNTEEYKNGLNN